MGDMGDMYRDWKKHKRLERDEPSLRDVAVRHSAEDAAVARRIRTAFVVAEKPAEPTGDTTKTKEV